jgi:hypothetical protein
MTLITRFPLYSVEDAPAGRADSYNRASMMMSRRLTLLTEIGLALAVLALAGSVLLDSRVKIDSDEAEWIGTTRYFQLYFVEHDVSAQSWPDEYWTRTQPMVVRYVIGSWLWWRGYDLKALDPTYDYTRNAALNRRAGLGPSDALLADGRTPTRGLAVLAIVTLYLVVRLLAGPVGGLTAAGLATGSPYLQEHLVRAKAESTLMFLLLATLLVGVIGIRWSERRGERWPGLGWGVGTGIMLGLAFGAKLTSILAIVAVVLWGIWACLSKVLAPPAQALTPNPAKALKGFLEARLRPPQPPLPVTRGSGAAEGSEVGGGVGIKGSEVDGAPQSPPPHAPQDPVSPPPRAGCGRRGGNRPWAWPIAVLVVTGLVFLASNPFLWPDPVGRTWLLFDNRREEMARQQKDVPSRAVYDLDRRIDVVWDRSVSNDAFGPSRLNWPVEAVLSVIGAGWLTLRALSRRPTALTLVFLWATCIWVGVTVGLGFLLQHYFVPTAMTADLLGGLAVGWAAQAVIRLGQRSPPQGYVPWRRVKAEPATTAVTGSPSTRAETVAESG